MEKPANVDTYIDANEKWRKELDFLRELVLSTGLEETIKWVFPTYMWNKKNIVAICAFKEYCGIWFYQGGSLADDFKVLMNAQEGKTKAMRQWRFHALEDINPELVLTYIEEAIQNQKDGNIIKFKRTPKPLIIPPEFKEVLDNNSTVAYSFESFSLSKKREFADYISNAKREATKQKRLKEIIPMILENIGLNDKYRVKK